MTETPINNIETRAQAKIDQLAWTDTEAYLVASFLLGEELPTYTLNKYVLWQRINESITFDDGEADILLQKAKDIVAQRQDVIDSNDIDRVDPEDDPEFDEYMYSSKKRAKTAASLIEPLLRMADISEGNELIRVPGYGGRKGKKTQSSFSQGTNKGQDIVDKGFIPTEDGGPHAVNAIYAPHYEGTKRRSDVRVRGSLAHELAHSVRALSNKSFWTDAADEAGKHNVPTTAEGNLHVGSHSTGSEAVTELFEAAVRFSHIKGKSPTIKEIIPQIATRLQDTTDSEKLNTKYLIPRFALLHHLEQLVEAGAGDVDAYDFVALGSYGYVSFEKTPGLIQLGLITSEKQFRMKKVMTELKDWLVSDNEDGFKLNP